MIGNGAPIHEILENTIDSLAEIIEVEKHFHNREKWFGLATAASGELHSADRMDGVILPFRLTAGASDFGSWVQVLGSTDTPVSSGMTRFDGHRVMIVTTDSTAPFIIQIMLGETVNFAAKLVAEEFTEFPYTSQSNNNDSGISEIKTIRGAAGDKVWARCACVGQTGKLIDFHFGIHEYLI